MSRTYRALLRILPRAFRDEFGPEMERTFVDARYDRGADRQLDRG